MFKPVCSILEICNTNTNAETWYVSILDQIFSVSLQAQANKPDLIPSTEDVIKEAEKSVPFGSGLEPVKGLDADEKDIIGHT